MLRLTSIYKYKVQFQRFQEIFLAIYALSIKHKAKGAGATAKAHALYIQREGKYKGLGEQKAQSHSAYLTREGKYQVRAQELELTWSGNLPSWAKTGKDFWEAADLYERANGRVYTEAVITLPRELSKEGRREVVQEFISKEIGDRFPYTVAIHNPKALDGGEQPHAHVMFSIRELDGIERSKELFFKRANTKCPEKGGAKKSREWSLDERGNDRLNEIRQTWEKLANKALEIEGYEVRIDRRSLKEQGIDREPEPKMGPEVTQKLKRGEETEIGARVIELRDYRRQEREVKELEVELEQERGKVLQFGERRGAEVSEENVLTFTKSGSTDRKIDENERHRYQRTLDLVLDKRELNDGRVEYVWKKSQRVAFTDHGNKITFNNISETAVKAGLQLAMQKGWGGVEVSGCVEFRRENWIQGQLMGVSVTGYKPQKLDFSVVEERRKEQELKKESLQKKAPDREQVRAVIDEPAQRKDLDWKEFSAVELERELKKVQIPDLEKKKSGIFNELQSLGFTTYEDDPLYFQYKVRNAWKDLPSNEELIERTFEQLGGTYYKQVKEHERRAFQRMEEHQRNVSQLEKGTFLQNLSPIKALQRMRLKEEGRKVDELYSWASKSLEKERIKLSTGRNTRSFEDRFNRLVNERDTTLEKRGLVEKQYNDVSSEINRASTLRLRLERLGRIKVRAVFEPGKGLKIDERDLSQKLEELQRQQSRSRDRGLGRSRGR